MSRADLDAAASGAGSTGPGPANVAWKILELARWAPSGDNTQPWRFELAADGWIVVHAFDTRRHCVYDLAGRASQLSVGALLETIRIAASAHGMTAHVVRRVDCSDEAPTFDVRLASSPGLHIDGLHACIRTRSVQRKRLSRRPLDATAKAALSAAVGSRHRVVWFEGSDRLRLAWLAVRSAKIRLTIPEAYVVHRDIIAWDTNFSADRVPDRALGASPASLASMRWAMASWARVHRMNRFFGGTLLPRIELDLLPAICCAAHFAIVADKAPLGIDDYVDAGAAVQRFWLTACSLKLQLQPQYTPLVFAAYARDHVQFTARSTGSAAAARAVEIERMLSKLLGKTDAEAAVFLGRVGAGPAAAARSVRLPLDRLMWSGPGTGPDTRTDPDLLAFIARRVA